jgi:hypothetical protein
MFFVSNLPSSSQAGRQSTYEAFGRIGNDKRASFRNQHECLVADQSRCPVAGQTDVLSIVAACWEGGGGESGQAPGAVVCWREPAAGSVSGTRILGRIRNHTGGCLVLYRT